MIINRTTQLDTCTLTVLSVQYNYLPYMCVGKHLLQFSKVVVNGYHSTGQLVSNIITCNMDVLYIL